MSENNPKLDPTHPLHVFRVHHILAHSYSVYFLLFLVGVILDVIFDVHIFANDLWRFVGAAVLILATGLILWAQHTSRHLHKYEISKEVFCRGPYCVTRCPTHWGLFFLMLGFGLVSNSFFVVLFTVVAFLLTRFTFLRKQEEALVQKYGEPYAAYKKSVKF